MLKYRVVLELNYVSVGVRALIPRPSSVSDSLSLPIHISFVLNLIDS
jgi:hypothetical protein